MSEVDIAVCKMYIPGGVVQTTAREEEEEEEEEEGGNWYSHPIRAIHYSAPQKEGRQRKRNPDHTEDTHTHTQS